ncbi:Hsp33 family molecular chaperone HslO [Arenimonas fontis]|uniref:Hsp33 family molecular chaperone HslO n=1 Tax=Arenimonas fontis TaxID=2608255 RepID=A0A5B2ZDZ8_9GAMM|nr:Hsp33 family molecular chaperone HslO [Arenimonas fontis]KAA2285464.1 Hsp33 family molecular chaperone HslO [Arenimonas fontis]
MSLENDCLTRFLLERSGVRGVLVHLDATWREIAGRAPYPPPVAARLGETCAATALFTGHAKVDGRLSVQMRGTGCLRTLFAECTAAGTLRGIARHAEPVPDHLGPRDFGEGSVLAITIESTPPGARETTRYQGLVGLDADTLAGAFEGYFQQSEQLPTRVLLAGLGPRAAGLMLQLLPADAGRAGDADGWTRCSALFDTLGPAELAALPVRELLWRLFHEEGVRVLDQRPLRFACSCSRERVAEMLRSLGRDEAEQALQDGQVDVHCEFCGQAYHFDAAQIGALFSQAPTAPGPTALQ